MEIDDEYWKLGFYSEICYDINSSDAEDGNFPALVVNTLLTDALVPKVARALADMVLAL